MSFPTYRDVFRLATGGNPPYAYQCRLACGPNANPDDESTLRNGTDCGSQLINIPTGLGKTAAIVLAWLWNRVFVPQLGGSSARPASDWPRRLVYCLPMRTLVEQTAGEAQKWIAALVKANVFPGEWPKVHILMGGADAGEWDIHPEKPAILIGTQDMLLSRALNRGYGMARARWPMHFGLLNNDCLWVLDETQLMGVGVRTSAQLEGLRAKIGTAIGCMTWWASATLDARLLATPDFPLLPSALGLEAADLNDAEVTRRIHAVKRVSTLPLTLVSDSAKVVGPYVEQLAAAVVDRHQPGSTTIIILNRVDRAQDLYSALEKIGRKQILSRLMLVHSRFRPMERDLLSGQIKEPDEKIIIATQAIEAGVDISSRTLITELAPWSSLVQRFGRCNRKGEFSERVVPGQHERMGGSQFKFNDSDGADIFWINLEAEEEKAAASLALPYAPEQLSTARALMRHAETVGASPADLAKLHAGEPLPEAHILRRKDVVDLFDTTPDLSGLDIDVGRYIRDGDERDVQVYWREIAAGESPADGIVPLRQELVRVPIYGTSGFDKFARNDKNRGGIWYWSVLDGEWQSLRPDRIAPGQVYLIDSALGGYSMTLGWTGEKSKEPFPLLTMDDQPKRDVARDGQDRDDESQTAREAWQTLETHTALVVAACEEKLQALPAAAPWAEALRTAARWHDAGKAHECFQTFITKGRAVPEDLATSFIAKSPWLPGIRFARPHFRHELASALAWLQAGPGDDRLFQSLVAWLIATHHGKIRLSLRAMPGETSPEPETPDQETPLYARGIWQGDKLPPVGEKRIEIEGFPPEGIKIDLGCMQMGEQDGRPSWTARALTLRDSPQIGLFRIAWLETILRAADAAGSAAARPQHQISPS
ncbi:MAG TPA: CRISPR-associated endonuclease Cas3'' [Chthoniobacterales bacterium]